MKKLLLATALASCRIASNRPHCSKQTGSSSTKGNHHPSYRFWVGRRKLSMQQNLWRRENAKQTETQQTFVNGLLGFITGVYSAWKRVCIAHNNCVSCPRYGQLLLLMYTSLFQLFLHSDQPLSEGEIIPFSGVCQSGGGCIIHAGGGGGFTLTDRLL